MMHLAGWRRPHVQQFPMFSGLRDAASGKETRKSLTSEYSWAIPNEKAIAKIASFSPIIEIGAGTGYWASLIAEAGGDIRAFDLNPPGVGAGKNDWHSTKAMHFPVEVGGAEKIQEFPARTLFLCWPPHAEDLVTQCLNVYRKDMFVYVGEVEACTGWDERLGSEWKVVEEIDIPQYEGIHDYLMVFKRCAS